MRKNAILKGIGYGVGLVFLTSACGIDSTSMIPSIICFACGGYLALFAYINRNYKVKSHEKRGGTYKFTHILKDKS